MKADSQMILAYLHVFGIDWELARSAKISDVFAPKIRVMGPSESQFPEKFNSRIPRFFKPFSHFPDLKS